MNWYKIALDLETLGDRNNLNKRIIEFKEAIRILKYVAKYVFQNAAHAKKVVENLAKNKRMSSFPELVKKLLYAASKALDNYKDFAITCNEVQSYISVEVINMEKIRKDFSDNIYPEKVRERINGKK